MKTRHTFMISALAMTLAFAAPVIAQETDVAEEGEAKAAEMMESHGEAMSGGEGCPCACMKAMHEKMMKMHGDAEGHAEGMAHDADGEHAEGMDSDEAHAEMMAAHQEMMASHKEMMSDCECMAGAMADGEGAMSCRMHGGHEAKGEMKGEGMQHRHGVDEDAEVEAEGRR